MSDALLGKFQAAHQTIVTTLDQIQPFIRDYSRAKPFIRDLHIKLFAHFGRENQEFFDALRDSCSAERTAVKMIEFLEVDLKDMKIKALTFAERHSGEMGDSHSSNFPKDFTEFSAAVAARMKMEVDYLFPLMAKL